MSPPTTGMAFVRGIDAQTERPQMLAAETQAMLSSERGISASPVPETA